MHLKLGLAVGMLSTLFIAVLSIGPLSAATATEDYGTFVEFKPLVRHMISQLHCYDVGTDDCEDTSHLGTNFTKEHTLGFLLYGSSRRMSSLGYKPLYLCEARNNSHLMMVTGGLLENDPVDACRDANFRHDRAGYISATANIEAPSPLYRCLHATTHDTLLTKNPAECTSATYGAAQLLGYLYAGGPQ